MLEQRNKRKRVLLFPYAHQFGSTAPLIMLGKHYRRMGHEVLVAGEGKYLRLAGGAGLSVERIPSFPYELYRKFADGGRFDKIFQPEIHQEFLQEDIKLLRTYRPDLAIYYLRFTVAVAGAIVGVKSVGATVGSVTHFYKGLPRLPRVEKSLRLLSYSPLSPLLARLWPYVIKPLLSHYTSRFNRWAAQVTPAWKCKSYECALMGEHIYLFLDSPKIFPLRPHPKILSYGPVVHDLVEHKSKFLAHLLACKKRGKRVVFINLGSSTVDRERVTDAILDSLGFSKYAYLVASFGEPLLTLRKKYAAQLNRGLFIESLVSLKYLEGFADVVITQGGKGNFYDAIRYGMVNIVIPNQSEQEINGLAAESLGIGRLFYRGTSWKRINALVEDIFANYQRYWQKIMSLRRSLDWNKYQRTAERLLQAL